MYIVISVSILSFILTCLDAKGILRNGMKYGFVFLAIIGAIHYDYGNDYMTYLDIYESITRFPFNLSDILDGSVFRDPGWAILCYFFKPIGGFYTMVAVLNILQNAMIYLIIRSEVSKSWWPFAVAIYVFSTAFYPLSFSMMRQELVMCCFIAMWPLIRKKRIFIALCLLICCSMVHSSALVLLPFAFFALIPFKNMKWLAILYVGLFVLMWVSGSFLNNFLQYVITIDEFEQYADIYGDSEGKLGFGIGYIVNQVPLILSIIYLFSNKSICRADDKLVVAIAAIGYLIIPFAQIIPLITRVSMYFRIYGIIALPKVYSNINNQTLRIILLLFFVFMLLIEYRGFWISDVYRDSYETFKTIFVQS